LPARQNIVVTRQSGYRANDAHVVATLEAALAAATLPPPVFCIGGGELYREAIPRADAIYVTDLERAFDGDTTFPPLDPDQWRATTRERHLPDTADGFAYTFVTYRRVAPPRRA
jgi:dihydrofolate reductase